MSGSGDGTVGKALEVLDQVASYGRPVRFSELLDASPFPKATLYRFVQTLTNQGMLSFDPDRVSDTIRSVPSRFEWPSAIADVDATPKASAATDAL